MPMIRDRFVPQIEGAGRPKKCMDILLWGANWTRKNQSNFDDLEVLREYLRSIRPSFCGIRVYVPASHAHTHALLRAMEISFIPTSIMAWESIPWMKHTMQDTSLWQNASYRWLQKPPKVTKS